MTTLEPACLEIGDLTPLGWCYECPTDKEYNYIWAARLEDMDQWVNYWQGK